MSWFDYMYYRIGKFYYKRDGRSVMGALVIVSLTQMALAGGISILILRFFFSGDQIASSPVKGREIGIVIGLIVLILNYFRYKGSYWKLSDRWREKETPAQQRIRGWLVVLSIFGSIALSILLGTAFR